MKLLGQYAYDPEVAQSFADAFRGSMSDKHSHQYEVVYASILAGRQIDSMLEIGVFLAEPPESSLNAWSQLYPNAAIYGADKRLPEVTSYGNINIVHVDQSSEESIDSFCASIGAEFDLVIDDASHIYNNTIRTFERVFQLVKPGGIYVIEDIRDELPPYHEWQQSVSQLQDYLDAQGHDYEIYRSTEPVKRIIRHFERTEEQKEIRGVLFSDEDRGSDDYIICISK